MKIIFILNLMSLSLFAKSTGYLNLERLHTLDLKVALNETLHLAYSLSYSDPSQKIILVPLIEFIDVYLREHPDFEKEFTEKYLKASSPDERRRLFPTLLKEALFVLQDKTKLYFKDKEIKEIMKNTFVIVQKLNQQNQQPLRFFLEHESCVIEHFKYSCELISAFKMYLEDSSI